MPNTTTNHPPRIALVETLASLTALGRDVDGLAQLSAEELDLLDRAKARLGIVARTRAALRRTMRPWKWVLKTDEREAVAALFTAPSADGYLTAAERAQLASVSIAERRSVLSRRFKSECPQRRGEPLHPRGEARRDLLVIIARGELDERYYTRLERDHFRYLSQGRPAAAKDALDYAAPPTTLDDAEGWLHAREYEARQAKAARQLKRFVVPSAAA